MERKRCKGQRISHGSAKFEMTGRRLNTQSKICPECLMGHRHKCEQIAPNRKPCSCVCQTDEVLALNLTIQASLRRQRLAGTAA
jgi:hypothetical protein